MLPKENMDGGIMQRSILGDENQFNEIKEKIRKKKLEEGVKKKSKGLKDKYR